MITFEEHNTNCGYALQDKVWVTDPDGTRWEIFVVTVADTAPDQNLDPVATIAPSPKVSCCA